MGENGWIHVERLIFALLISLFDCPQVKVHESEMVAYGCSPLHNIARTLFSR